jgi:Fur family transcriptional regulator, ferric uptake regulator
MDWVDSVVDELSNERHRITEPRKDLLRRIAAYSRPFTAEQVYADTQDAGKTIGRATVYRTLELLLSRRWLARIHREDGEHAYVVTDGGHEHHLVCTICGTAIAFEGCDFDAMLGGLAQRLGFQIEGHWVEAFGRCQRCQRISGRSD